MDIFEHVGIVLRRSLSTSFVYRVKLIKGIALPSTRAILIDQRTTQLWSPEHIFAPSTIHCTFLRQWFLGCTDCDISLWYSTCVLRGMLLVIVFEQVALEIEWFSIRPSNGLWKAREREIPCSMNSSPPPHPPLPPLKRTPLSLGCFVNGTLTQRCILWKRNVPSLSLFRVFFLLGIQKHFLLFCAVWATAVTSWFNVTFDVLICKAFKAFFLTSFLNWTAYP